MQLLPPNCNVALEAGVRHQVVLCACTLSESQEVSNWEDPGVWALNGICSKISPENFVIVL